jgi:hypothetical protein
MGNCLTHLRKEMQAPPARPGNWEGLSPQHPDVHSPSPKRDVQAERDQLKQYEINSDNKIGVPLRKETESGIPGLTYDQAGRPV